MTKWCARLPGLSDGSALRGPQGMIQSGACALPQQKESKKKTRTIATIAPERGRPPVILRPARPSGPCPGPAERARRGMGHTTAIVTAARGTIAGVATMGATIAGVATGRPTDMALLLCCACSVSLCLCFKLCCWKTVRFCAGQARHAVTKATNASLMSRCGRACVTVGRGHSLVTHY